MLSLPSANVMNPFVPMACQDTVTFLKSNRSSVLRPKRKSSSALHHTSSLPTQEFAPLLLFLLQAVTGILLRFVYEPTPVGAYDSIQFIQEEVVFGRLVRNIHHWSGMLVVVIFLYSLIYTILLKFNIKYSKPFLN